LGGDRLVGSEKVATIPRAERRRGLIVLLADAFLMWAGFFMVVPLIAVHYVDGLGWSAGAVGLILGVRQATQQGFAFLGGVLADRFGARRLICGGLLIRIFGFSSMAIADSFPLLLLSSLVVALKRHATPPSPP
jgi:DHA1 family multidrug resistance protein-like MFS transporter